MDYMRGMRCVCVCKGVGVTGVGSGYLKRAGGYLRGGEVPRDSVHEFTENHTKCINIYFLGEVRLIHL